MLVAEHRSRSIALTLPDGTVEILVENYADKPLTSPNDIAVRSGGAIYFTDPKFGLKDRPWDVDFMGPFAWIQMVGWS